MEKKVSVSAIRKFATPIRSVLRSIGSDEHESEYIAWSASYDPSGYLLEETKFFDDGDIEEIHSYTYNKNGQVLTHVIEIPGEGIEESFITERNADGNPVKITKMYGDEPGEYTTFEYGENARPVKIEHYDPDAEHERTEILFYDDQGLLIKKQIINHQEKSENVYVLTYHEKGWLLLQEEMDASGKVVGRLTFEYDDEGKELFSRQTNEKGEQVAEIINTYNEIGKIIKRESHTFYIRISSFEYDEAGNVVEETLADENGFVITRNRYSYGENNLIEEETVYETDLTRGGRDTHLVNRFEYEFHS